MTKVADPEGRIAPVDRERVIALLTQQFASDVITESELEDRLSRVYQASTGAELAAIVADLTASVPAERTERERITALFSGQERRIMDVMPRELQLRARVGNIELDLTEAKFQDGVTTIDVRAVMGYVQIRFPAGVRVETRGRALFGYFSQKGAGSSGAGPLVRVNGRATFAFVECLESPGEPR